jgi:hypothetical protein
MPNQLKWKCPACSITARLPANHGAIHCCCGFTQYRNPPGLGDRVAAVLARTGMTEQRYKAIKKRLGLKPDCGCKKRQRALNRIA